MKPHRFVLLLIAVLLLTLGTIAAACGGDSIPKPSPTPTTEETPTAQATQGPTEAPTTAATELAYEEFVSPRLGYRIDTPEEWITVEDFPVEYGGESFLADAFLVPVPERGFSANVNVMAVPALGRTFDQIIVLERAYARESSQDIQEDGLVVGGHEAKIIHSTSGRRRGAPRAFSGLRCNR